MKLFAARLVFVGIVLGLASGAILFKLFSIQIVHGAEYAAQSKKQSQSRTVILSSRGRILDRKGRVFASNVESKIKMSVSQLEFMPDDTIRGAVGKRRGTAQFGRLYPYGSLAASVIGFVGKDGYGLGGMEFSFDKYLRGENGWAILQRDARIKNGRQTRYRLNDLPSKPAVDGCDVISTLDLDIQKITESVLHQTVQKYNAKAGMAMVMDPATGNILAMANEPGFDANIATNFSARQRQNLCISENYEPGSTFKLVTAAAALEQKVKKESDTIDGNMGRFEIFDQTIKDHRPYGKITFADAVAYSSNVCFAKVANDLGNERLYNYTVNFGFGSRTGIALPGEEAGIVHPIARWSGRTRVTMAIGQEISATFLQMMMLYAAVANDGVLVEPRICEKIVRNGEVMVDSGSVKPVRRVISADIARRLAAMLEGVVVYGTGENAQMAGVTVAGKTGTSQKLDRETSSYSNLLSYASFIGFVPADRPSLVAGVVIDEPGNAEFGGTAAAPAFKQIVTQIISNPELEFAEKTISSQRNKTDSDTAAKKPAPVVRRVPLLAGYTRAKAQKTLTRANIRFEIFGNGDTITAQTPESGTALGDSTKILIYAHRRAGAGIADQTRVVPDCRGRDLRDALNILNIRGIAPFVQGSGMVRSQRPDEGSLVRPAQVCTLYCSFEG